MEKKFNSMIALNHKPSASIHTVTSGYFTFSSALAVQFLWNVRVYERNRNKSCIWHKIEDNVISLYILSINCILHVYSQKEFYVVSHINESKNIVAYQKYHVTSFQRYILKRLLMKAKTFLEYICYKDVTLRIT